jgi:anti-sigma regulatory factor (Ser/Thr protein kinase)
MTGASVKPFRHTALLYDGEDSFLSGTVPFIREGLAADEPVMVAVNAEKSALLSEALGPESADVTFADMAMLGVNPARFISAWAGWREQVAPNCPARGIGEPLALERSDAELVEIQLHEALVNRAFAGVDGLQLLCPYDKSLPFSVLEEACCSHPFVANGEHEHVSPLYRGPDALPPAAEAPLQPPPSTARVLGFDRRNLAEIRALTAEVAELAGLDSIETGQFVLGVHELAANSVRHGGGIGVLRAWVEEGAAVCEVRDAGHITDPLAGRHAPRTGQLGGWGLWLANAACSLLQLRTGPEGTVIRVRRSRG